jgi:uncharacterized protein
MIFMGEKADDLNRRAIAFRNARGLTLYGILEEPAGGATGARHAALLFSPGLKSRVAPHRLYRKLLGPFLERGIPVLRLDFAGLGDSEGDWSERSQEHIFRMTELGHHVDDVRCAFDWLQAHCGIRRFIAGGLCGAAITALLASVQDARLAALYAIGFPATLHGSQGDKHLAQSELHAHRRRYLRKLLRPGAWLRLLSLQSDYRLIWRLAREALRARASADAGAAEQAAPSAPKPDFNPRVPFAMFEMLAAGRPALVLFGEDDALRYSFEESFMQPWRRALKQYQALFTYAVIPGANHVLADPRALAEAKRLTGLWLDRLLPVAQEDEGRRPLSRAA